MPFINLILFIYCSELEDYPDKPPLVDVVVLKATEDYLLGFNSRSEKEAWFQHYQKLRRVCMPRKGVWSHGIGTTKLGIIVAQISAVNTVFRVLVVFE